MTCVVGLEVPRGGVVVGCDSASTGVINVDDGSGKTSHALAGDRLIDAASKIVRRGGWLVGIAGDWRLLDVVASAALPAPGPTRSHAQSAADELREAACEAYELDDCSALLAGAGRVWVVESSTWHAYRSRSGFAAIGSGRELALGYLEGSRGDTDGRRRVRGAIKAAARWRADVEGPVRVVAAHNK